MEIEDLDECDMGIEQLEWLENLERREEVVEIRDALELVRIALMKMRLPSELNFVLRALLNPAVEKLNAWIIETCEE